MGVKYGCAAAAKQGEKTPQKRQIGDRGGNGSKSKNPVTVAVTGFFMELVM